MEYLTVDEAAQALKVHPVTLRLWCSDGRIPAVKAGTRWRIPKYVVDESTEDESNIPALMDEEKARTLAKSVYDALIANIPVTITIGGIDGSKK